MKLSVIIVNYNVKYFLEQALYSVRKAAQGLPVEVFVVDNNSVDGSVEMVRQKFPEFRLLANKENKGFSYANNQAINQSSGEYILLLNPDTVVQEDTFQKVIHFMDTHPDAGGLGVKMIDGKGKFLPESKRGLPSPLVAFYKIFGLAFLFPGSRMFGRYHLGYLDKEQTHEIDVLSGAFMLLRKSVLDEVGLLDETFFMYGEDIDLSYRITKAGYKNYYYPGTTIIHYKGESTRKSSINYVLVFYKAMVIFARKHFAQQKASAFSFLIYMAIYIRMGMAIVFRVLKQATQPLLDAGTIVGGMYLIKSYWEERVKGGAADYPPEFMYVNVPFYTLFWLIGVYMSGGYDKGAGAGKVVRGIFAGTVAIAVIYGFLDESLRFSRMLILLGAIYTIVGMLFWRLVLHFIITGNLKLGSSLNKRTIIVGSEPEANRVLQVLRSATSNNHFIGFVGTGVAYTDKDFYLGNLEQLDEVIEIFRIDEIIFCSKDVRSDLIMNAMASYQRRPIEFKIVPEDSLFIIGSNSKEKAGDLYTIDIRLALSIPQVRRKKRILDLLVCAAMIPLFPLMIFFMKRPHRFPGNWFRVLIGKRTWVGFVPVSTPARLPALQPGILDPGLGSAQRESDEFTRQKINFFYARDYSVYTDLEILLKGIPNLGN